MVRLRPVIRTKPNFIHHERKDVHDVEGNDGFAFGGDDDHYGSFEETDFTKLEIY